jgi:tetratricopeptide (TPR) repeat protein
MRNALLLPVVVMATMAVGPEARAGGDLAGAAAASPRPPECRLGSARAAPALWSRARVPELGRFCDALARGYARLARSPQDAAAQAEQAERALPGRAATWVLRGRASFALGQYAASFRDLGRAWKASPHSLDAPGALHDLGRSALVTGHHPEALAAYRALVPRTALLDSETLRQRIYVEAAALAMSTGALGLNEALGYLGEARSVAGTPGFENLVLASLALTLDRQGRKKEAEGVLRELRGTFDVQAFVKSGHAPHLPPGELIALSAIVGERPGSARTVSEWSELADKHPKSPWAAHARAKAGAPQRGPGKGHD